MSVTLQRKVTFSSGHRYWFGHLSEEENRRLFGPWASPYNHGHNYVLWASVRGEVEEETGMVINIKTIDQILKDKILARYDQKSINDEVPGFDRIAACLENILADIREQLADLPPEAELTGLCLEETPLLFAEWSRDDDMLTLTRVYEFAASHRLYAPNLPEDRNDDLYGKCANPHGHGHNYVLEVTVTGEPNPETGMIVDIGAMDEAVNREVVDRYDHKNLNLDIPEFEGRITSSEIVTREIFDRLDGKLPATLHKVRLLETARNAFEVTR